MFLLGDLETRDIDLECLEFLGEFLLSSVILFFDLLRILISSVLDCYISKELRAPSGNFKLLLFSKISLLFWLCSSLLLIYGFLLLVNWDLDWKSL